MTDTSTEATLFVGLYGQPARRLTGDLRREPALGAAIPQTRNASFCVSAPETGALYLVDEQDEGRVTAFKQGAEGEWRHLASVASGGGAPCFLDCDPRGQILAVANYQSGNIAVYRLDTEGVPQGDPLVQAHHGSGPVEDRQQGPHVHCVRFHEQWLYSVDLGADVVMARKYGASPPSLAGAFIAFSAPPGEGPRHLIFHPDRHTAYLLSELGSRLFVLDVGPDGRLEQREVHSTLPQGFAGESLGGHLAINAAGDRLYASNRGHDSIAVFAIEANGDVATLQHAPTGGTSPRHFLLLQDRRLCVVAHEEGGGVSILTLGDDGRLGGPVFTAPCDKAVFIGQVWRATPPPWPLRELVALRSDGAGAGGSGCRAHRCSGTGDRGAAFGGWGGSDAACAGGSGIAGAKPVCAGRRPRAEFIPCLGR